MKAIKNTIKQIPKVSKHFQTFTITNAFWIAIAAGIIFTLITFWRNFDVGTRTIDSQFHLLLTFSVNMVMSFMLYVYNFSIIKSRLSTAARFLLVTIGSFIIATVCSLSSAILQKWIYHDPEFSTNVSTTAMRDSIVAITSVLLTALLYNINRRHQNALEIEHLQAENLMIRYDALEKQLDPHFLFNSLNTLGGLIGTDTEKAKNYLQQLASTYRYITRSNKPTTLSEELTFADSYIYMMQIRYGDNLTIEKHIPDPYLASYIVPISLQLLLENAMKHNIISERHPLTVTIEVTKDHNLRVSNPLQPKYGIETASAQPSQGTSVGLANLNKRYQLLFQRSINIDQSNGCFAVEIPLISPMEAEKVIRTIDDHLNNNN